MNTKSYFLMHKIGCAENIISNVTPEHSDIDFEYE